MKTLTKKLIAFAGAAVVGGCIGAVLGYGPLLNYKSEGILSVEMGISEYERFAELANDPDVITRYIAATSIPNISEDQRKKLVAVVIKGGWQKLIPKVSKADSKEPPEFLIQSKTRAYEKSGGKRAATATDTTTTGLYRTATGLC